MQKIYELYEDECQSKAVMDFGELLLYSYEILSQKKEILEHY